ncbi:hypothetical protein [Hoeflea ulvae]|uniref:Uncharacterized protein n=1 Tax=Hoeflea ulvae TaxID=2983764 RepID=A0ABT3YCQ6_9HYPH|nr:hypothetical protein [Hoeflea ulvae]MCY0093597.1 hypothetical protein [Hoeflea ulvae]
MIDTFTPPKGNASFAKKDLADKSHSSQASVAITWDSAEVELDSNLVLELKKAIDAASAVIGQLTAQSKSLLGAVETVIREIVKLQKNSEKQLELAWDFHVDVKEESAFLVRHSQIVEWKATKVGDLKGTGYVDAVSTVQLPQGLAEELDVTQRYSTNLTQPRFANQKCHVTYLSAGKRISNIRTVLKVTLPSVATQLGALLEDLLDLIKVIGTAVGKAGQAVYDKLKGSIESLLSPFALKAGPAPKDEPDAIDYLSKALEKFLSVLSKLAGEVSGRISLEQSTLSFQAVSDSFYDTWLRAKDRRAKIDAVPDTRKQAQKENSGSNGESPEDGEVPSGDSNASLPIPWADGAEAVPESALIAAEVPLSGTHLELIAIKDGMRLAYNPVRPGASEFIISARMLEEMQIEESKKDKKDR